MSTGGGTPDTPLRCRTCSTDGRRCKTRGYKRKSHYSAGVEIGSAGSIFSSSLWRDRSLSRICSISSITSARIFGGSPAWLMILQGYSFSGKKYGTLSLTALWDAWAGEVRSQNIILPISCRRAFAEGGWRGLFFRPTEPKGLACSQSACNNTAN